LNVSSKVYSNKNIQYFSQVQLVIMLQYQLFCWHCESPAVKFTIYCRTNDDRQCNATYNWY